MAIPQTLNGYPVLAAVPRFATLGREPVDLVVLVDRSASPAYAEDPYVTALWWERLGTTWSAGNYHRRLDSAVADLATRSGLAFAQMRERDREAAEAKYRAEGLIA